MTAKPVRTSPPADLVTRRAASLGPTYKAFYDKPIEIVEAHGVWMFDQTGAKFLDAYNNVPVVGHSHPHVVEALASQAARLNTHTRYLHEGIVDFADRILATMPREIGHVIFTCTGSEANDLAYRVALANTGGEGFIVSEHAYHGNTLATSALSPSAGTSLVGRNVYMVPAPEPKSEASFADGVADAISRMERDGVRLAGMIADTVLSSDGIFVEPHGFLREAVELVRAKGGVFIADEVQPGHGRLGAAMWGFDAQGIGPDIVTMGKPMGNGFPLAAVAVRPELMVSFREISGYFNTFGGNPVAAAVGNAVLDVLESEALLPSAERVGAYFRAQLKDLASRHRTITSVRGLGLFIGVELDDAIVNVGAKVSNEMRERGVLVGTAGKQGNCLKIRPPLVFKEAHVDLFIEQFENVLTQELPSWQV